jgi:hypothetical protein
MNRKKRIALVAVSFVAGVALFPFIFLAGWCLIYAMPPTPSKTVDLRASAAVKPYYLLFCSSLADNTFAGYPGHCYVVWSLKHPVNFPETESAGFVPHYVKDQIPSLYKEVPGLLVRDAWKGNLKTFTSLTAIVDSEVYEKTRRVRESWRGDVFRVGVRDCVKFSDGIAKAAGLRTPSSDYRYPQDFIKDLKALY